MASTVSDTFGALLVGGFIAAVFSGIVSVQTAVYYKFYPADRVAVKLLVFFVWFCDLLHTAFIGRSLWYYFIMRFGDKDAIDFIAWSLASTIAVTALLTFCVHCFFVHRIYKLSEHNYYVAIPLAFIAVLRLFFACLTTAKLILLQSFHKFALQYHWSFTCGLALSSLLDVLITAFLCYFLMNGRKKSTALNDILDSLVLYAFESGSLTSLATVLSMIFWLVMRTNLVFMALHFVISKFYANSLLATLNTRRLYLEKAMTSGGLVVNSAEARAARRTTQRWSKAPPNMPVRITIQESVIRTITDDKTTVILDHVAHLDHYDTLDRMSPSPSPTSKDMLVGNKDESYAV